MTAASLHWAEQAAEVDQNHRMVRTRALARYEQFRMTTQDKVVAAYQELADAPFSVLEKIRTAMETYARHWRERVIDANEKNFSAPELQACADDLKGFEAEVETFSAGIAALASGSPVGNRFPGDEPSGGYRTPLMLEAFPNRLHR